MQRYASRIRWTLFGSMQMMLSLLIIASIYITGEAVGGESQKWLYIVAGACVGLEYVMILYRWKVLWKFADESSR